MARNSTSCTFIIRSISELAYTFGRIPNPSLSLRLRFSKNGQLMCELVRSTHILTTLFWAHRLHDMQSVLEDVLRLAERSGSEEARLQAVALMPQGHRALGELND